MIQIGTLFKLLEQPPRYLPGAAASFARPGYREITLRGFDVRLEIDGRIYELSSSNAPGNDGFRSRGLAFARQVVPLAPAMSLELAPAMSLEQQILLPNAGDAVAISWRLVGKKIAPVRLTATPIFSSAEPTSSEIFTFDAEHDGGRLTWLPFRRACKIIADANGRCTEPSLTIKSDGEPSSTAPSAFVFNLGRRPSLLLLSVELPTNGAPDPLMGSFLAALANPEREERAFLSAA
jgi:hypothetical protein